MVKLITDRYDHVYASIDNVIVILGSQYYCKESVILIGGVTLSL